MKLPSKLFSCGQARDDAGILSMVVLCALLIMSAANAADPVAGLEPATEHDDHGEFPVIEQGTLNEVCTDGTSGGFPCRNIEMLSRIPLDTLGGDSGNDSWGWKDENTNRYYALMGLNNGVAFVDVTDPADPLMLGSLPSNQGSSSWRDIKTWANHAYVVADGISGHGMQVLNLLRLRNGNPERTYVPETIYEGFGSAHNIAINEDSGFAYVVGSDSCNGGLHMIDLSEPEEPQFVGCFSGDGYTHDVQCVNYAGPDPDFDGRELCFASNEDSLTITDVTNKQAPQLVGKLQYPDVAYSHQGWLDEEHRYFLLGDEIDELATGMNARTLVFDVTDLEKPRLAGAHQGANNTIDHNLYVKGAYIFQANYSAGLRILLAEDLSSGSMQEVAYFDTSPSSDSRNFVGAWNVYPFFDNGTLLVSDINSGLFVLRANLSPAEGAPINGRLSGAWVAQGLNDQGMTIIVGENISGPYVYFAWFLFRDGQPFWLSGAAPFTWGSDRVDIPTERLSGLEFLAPGEATAERVNIGNLHLHAHHCNSIHLLYDFEAPFGSGELHMERVASVQGRECPPGG